jgi:hypothetical protein
MLWLILNFFNSSCLLSPVSSPPPPRLLASPLSSYLYHHQCPSFFHTTRFFLCSLSSLLPLFYPPPLYVLSLFGSSPFSLFPPLYQGCLYLCSIPSPLHNICPCTFAASYLGSQCFHYHCPSTLTTLVSYTIRHPFNCTLSLLYSYTASISSPDIYSDNMTFGGYQVYSIWGSEALSFNGS